MHTLTDTERRKSAEASRRLGFAVDCYQDGNWHVEPVAKGWFMGSAPSLDDAIAACVESNAELAYRAIMAETPFTVFWRAINAELSARGVPELLYADAGELWAKTVDMARGLSRAPKIKS